MIAPSFENMERGKQFFHVGGTKSPLMLLRSDESLSPLQSRERVGQVEDKQQATGLEDSAEFRERPLRVSAPFVDVLEDANSEDCIEGLVWEWDKCRIAAFCERNSGQRDELWCAIQGVGVREKSVLSQEVREVPIAASPVEARVSGAEVLKRLCVNQSFLIEIDAGRPLVRQVGIKNKTGIKIHAEVFH